jgi:hypothetical protein
MHLSLEHRLNLVRDFLALAFDRIEDMTKGGDRDVARYLVNLFENMQLLELCADNEHGVLSGSEFTRMRKRLSQLRSGCHPANVPDYGSDLAAIRSQVSEIKNLVVTLAGPAAPVVSEAINVIPFPQTAA